MYVLCTITIYFVVTWITITNFLYLDYINLCFPFFHLFICFNFYGILCILILCPQVINTPVSDG